MSESTFKIEQHKMRDLTVRTKKYLSKSKARVLKPCCIQKSKVILKKIKQIEAAGERKEVH